MTILLFAIASGIAALAFAGALTVNILRQDAANEAVQKIGDAIEEGARAFLSLEYRLLAVFVVVIAVVLAVFIDYDVTGRVAEATTRVEGGPQRAFDRHRLPCGAIGSALAGFAGMSIAVRANTRTTVKAAARPQPRTANRLQ